MQPGEHAASTPVQDFSSSPKIILHLFLLCSDESIAGQETRKLSGSMSTAMAELRAVFLR